MWVSWGSMKLPLVLLLAASTVVWVKSKPKSSEALVFTNVNVVDVRDGHVERNLAVCANRRKPRWPSAIGLPC